MKLKLSNILVLFLLVSLSSSCASLDKYDRGYTHPYTATVTDSCMIWLSSTGYRGDPEHPDGFDFIYYPIFIPFFIVDLPFSIVKDTITLPYDLYHQDKIEEELCGCNCEEETSDEEVIIEECSDKKASI